MKKAILTICLICLSICLYDGQANTIVEQPTSLNNQTTNNNTNQSAEELEGWTFHTNAKLYRYKGTDRYQGACENIINGHRCGHSPSEHGLKEY